MEKWAKSAKSAKTGSEALGELIRARRGQLGLSRRDLVEATGLSYPYVSQLETGYRLPSSTALRDLAAALAVSTDDLVATMPGERSAARSASRSTGAWHANPAYATPAVDALMEPVGSAPPEADTGTRRVVQDVVRRLSALPADQRLDALGDVQRAVLAGLVEEQIRDTR